MAANRFGVSSGVMKVLSNQTVGAVVQLCDHTKNTQMRFRRENGTLWCLNVRGLQ